jgi:hypothetical protein
MKQFTKPILLPLLLLFFIFGCSSKDMPEESVFKYKDSNIGDNSAIGNLIKQLSYSEQFLKLSLQTNKKPYGMVMEYGKIDDAAMKEAIINNAAYIFTLVQNAEWITFKIGSQNYSVTRKKLHEWFRTDLRKIKNESSLKRIIDKHLDKEQELNHILIKLN